MSALGWILLLVGIVFGLTLPKRDRRFKSGFKDNRVPSGRHMLATFGCLIVGILLLWMGYFK